MSNLDQYKVQHLLLLVGENPLPNYVAALTLLKDGGTVYLVFTEHTKTQKICLLKQLREQKEVNIDKKIEPIDLAKYESDSYQIREKIQKRIKSVAGSIGLHYTGGTKAMAVHAYRAVQELQPDAFFSYLDSRTLEMCIDRPNNSPIREKVSLKISFTKLFGLHNLKWQDDRPPSADPTLPEAAAKFAEFYQNKDLAKAWRDWCNNKLRRQMKYYDQRNNHVWKPEDELKAQPTIEVQSLPTEIKNLLRQHLDASTDVLNISVTQKKGFNDLTHVCAWLDGVWLEDYVLQQVKQLPSQYGIKKAGMSFHIDDRENHSKKYPKFEFDVAFMLGYQLFAISCTTSDKPSLCKQKLFEASIRARQLGGDEARVALVCCYDQPSYIKSQLRTTIADRKIEVFGREDLLNLERKIGQWIDKNNQEANQ
ncbi:Card1-like endonuclease domain-containing protein [Oxynema aestuarii]|uniref:DUF1887 family protein n=1 Tax=Oxynema aestuarii AP17 TaxID=2064643 RepID=A0A6H1U1D8_9CYAN|nr:DUF1887 family CARF protein [Oxynema aestuarii]QIZ72197.1 DUF1887 family protein [Oxynema aestuarii AP17]